MLTDKILAATALDGWQLAALMLLAMLAAIVRGYAGFGFSAIVVASASLFMPTREAVPLVLALEVLASLQMARQVWGHINWRLVSCILLGVVFFSPLGQFALRAADIDLMRLITAALLLAAIALTASGRFFAVRNAPRGWIATGVISGFMNGLLAMGGMWTIALLINSGVQVAVLRASLIALFFITDIYALSAAALYGLADEKMLARAACCLPPMLIGIKIGAAKFNPEQQAVYKKVALIILTLLALLLIARTLIGQI